jgi:hypothetical protein
MVIGGTLAMRCCVRPSPVRLGSIWFDPVLWLTAAVSMLIVLSGHSRNAFRIDTQPPVWLLGVAVVSRW